MVVGKREGLGIGRRMLVGKGGRAKSRKGNE